MCIRDSIYIETTKEFEDSTVSRILELVEDAASEKAPMENFITRFARYYTPIVCLLALLIAIIPPFFTGFDWADWVQRALIFLVVSCPCALVISVPLSFFGGIGGASKRGILKMCIRDSERPARQGNETAIVSREAMRRTHYRFEE